MLTHLVLLMTLSHGQAKVERGFDFKKIHALTLRIYFKKYTV